MTRIDVEALIKDTYVARQVADVARLVSYFDTDCDFKIVAESTLGHLARPISGHALYPALAEMCETFDWSQFSIVELFVDMGVDPIRATVRSAGTMTHKPTDIRFDLEILDVVGVRDGKIVSFREFFDTQKAAKMLGIEG